MRLSFIIPVFNGGDFIVRCLDSIYGVGMPQNDFEIIVVDDCSTDDTREVISSYILKHAQVRLICQSENHRQGAARNRGLKEAKGDYVAFVDGDDIVLDGLLPAINWAERLKVGMVYCSCYHEKSDSDAILKEIDLPEGEVLSGRDFCEKYQDEGVFWYPWGFLIRREWLVSLNYPFIEDRQHEDRDWMAYVLSSADTVCNSKRPMYRYVCNPTSTCRHPKYSTLIDHVASGIRHIHLSEQLSEKCPKMSKTLNLFGIDEIYKSIRLRNLSKYPWSENKHLYDSDHLEPLLPDLRILFQEHKLPRQIFPAIYLKHLELLIISVAYPIARFGRRIVAIVRH